MELKGIAASAGYALGHVCFLKEISNDFAATVLPEQREAERERFLAAQVKARLALEELKEKAAKTMGAHQAEVFAAHQMMLEDPTLMEGIFEKIDSASASAEAAVSETVETIAAMFSAMNDDYMRERAADIKDIGLRLLRILQGIEDAAAYQGILAAQDLLPSDTASLDLDKVFGFVTALGGKTSHSSILARAAGIPAVVGLGAQLAELKDGDMLIVDGHAGSVLVNPAQEVIEEYRLRQQREKQLAARLAEIAHLPSVTTDGYEVELAANIGTPENMTKAVAAGAEGVGLFRTEFLFLDKTSVPTEEEQYQAYKTVLEALPKGKIVIRTLDAGGDKQLSFIGGLKEENPALGLRAIRLCLVYRDVFKTQLRALLRAGVHGNLHIMFPMIATLEELRTAKSLLQEAAAELTAEGVVHRKDVPVGIMVEVPAAAMLADELAQEVAFFSIGTNDLVQYTMAADRMNEHVATLSDYFQPPVIRLIGQVAKAAERHGKWVGMCGEMAGDVLSTPLLLGLGLTELSMNARSIPLVKYRVRQLQQTDAKELAEQVLKLSTASAIKAALENFSTRFAD
ncbi:phosphoenolpyruvate--protein phosphotransferase [Azotosporobacter soli]|uniref:phosphoenolpyruvate--protein phosphotransferase n=1 Tax=Azotosporobacter soli TaxID=3055040 RepID=UPI0031FF1C27